MSKSGLIDAVGRTTSIAKREGEDAVHALVRAVSKEVRSGGRGVLVGLGGFAPLRRNSPTRRHPHDSSPVGVAAIRGLLDAGAAVRHAVGKITAKAASSAASAVVPQPTKVSTPPARSPVAAKASNKVVGHVAAANGRPARSGENSSTTIGQKGRRENPGEDSITATGQEGR